MARLVLTTRIEAPIERCFDLALDVGLHQQSTAHTREFVVAGRTSGLCELEDLITWEARHLGVRQRLTVQITELRRPYFFRDIMRKGAFRSMEHEHLFESKGGFTLMTDVFAYTVPLGWPGQLFDRLFLAGYLRRFLQQRNYFLKQVAESR
ncbi:SRPBCC family protein [Hymenobacter sp. B81]|uniref:SRPBCC family protein n=1 Tax=Hymenobacter sp. B81 TaxID=3344878 RepID=UPI0037DD98FB